MSHYREKGLLDNTLLGKLNPYVYFFKIRQESKSLRKSYEDYFIDKFKLLLNKKTYVTKPPQVAVPSDT